jgi:hypothetical protein
MGRLAEVELSRAPVQAGTAAFMARGTTPGCGGGQHDAERGWIADVSWFRDYSSAGGEHTAAVPADRIRPAREQAAPAGDGREPAGST